MTKTLTAKIERDGNDVILVFPKGFIESLGLKVGDDVEWCLGSDGTVIITPCATGDQIVLDAKDALAELKKR